MKSLILTFFCSILALILPAQTELDTTIYNVADQMPFPYIKSCMPERNPSWDGNLDSVRRCAETQFFSILANNIRYPEEARINNLQGSVVVSCVIEPNSGRMTNLSILKDIGGGCGDEALRVLQALEGAGLRWQPGVLGGKQVRVRHALPIRFRLQEALPYFIAESGDTIHTVLDKGPDFKGGVDSLLSFIVNRLEYPTDWRETCKTGVIEMEALIHKNGTVTVDNQLDFNNLGMDFQFEALRLLRRSAGMWIPAEHKEKAVNCILPLRVVFKSDSKFCSEANDKFDRAMILADEGAALLEQDKPEEAIQKWNEALVLQPDNCELLYYRGTAKMNQNNREEACKDYNRVKELLGITWFEDIRRLVCGF